jgi:hypothetical protein
MNPYQYSLAAPTLYWDPNGEVAYHITQETVGEGDDAPTVTTGHFETTKGDTIDRVVDRLGIPKENITNADKLETDASGHLTPGQTLTVKMTPRLELYASAARDVGSTRWKETFEPRGKNGELKPTCHCNQFIGAKGRDAQQHFPGLKAGEWGDKNLEVPGTSQVPGGVKDAKPGDVVGWALKTPNASGHVVIAGGQVDIIQADGTTIKAGEGLAIGASDKSVTATPMAPKDTYFTGKQDENTAPDAPHGAVVRRLDE